ncbi:MAG: lysylphosphatidylglycerol synthase transmembrane domain-containing protein [Anaerolineales bacterium]|nr:flippase-like domain-containing protein [Anaerolineales bacterium]
MKKRLLIAFLATLVIGGIFFWFVDLDQVIDLLRLADWRFLSAAVVALVVAYILLALRWRYLLGNQPGFLPSFHSVNMSNLVNSLTPIPEIALRVLITGKGTGMSIPGATSGMLVERSLEQVMRVLAFLVALLTGYVVAVSSGSVVLNASLIIGFLVLMALLLRNAERVILWIQNQITRFPRLDQPRVERVLSDLVAGLKMAGGPRQLSIGWLMSFAIWSGFFAFVYLVLIGLNIQLPVPQMIAISMLTLAVAPPSAPGTPGLYQATIVGALSLIAGLDLAMMTTYAIMIHILQVIPLLFLGFWGVLGTNLSLRGLLQQRQQVVLIEQETD